MEDVNALNFATVVSEPPVINRPQFRPLPLATRAEPRWVRLAVGILACEIAVAFFLFLFQYYAPAHSGVDQNGYLVGGKMLAWTGSTGMKPEEPLGFVSNMWVRNDDTGWNYPKYPVGLPLLYAICLWTCGALGTKAAYLVSPLGAALAVLGVYFLARRYAGTFASLCAMLLLACSPVTLVLANNPNSHASCLAFCVWGVFLLIRFWETGSTWRGLLAGFLLGFAVTIRYTEGLLGMLIGMVVLSTLVAARFKDFKNWRGHLAWLSPLIGWAIPVAWLLIFNRVAMGTWTGYDTTNESVAFTLENFLGNWELFVRKVNDTGLFFILPLGVLGMVLSLRSSMRRGILLWLWLVPGTLIYLSYYWAPERGMSYLRFFMTLLPPLVIGAAVTIDLVISSAKTRFGRVASPLAGGLIVAIACCMNLYRGQLGLEDGQETGQGMEALYRQQVNLAALGDVVTQTVPAGSVVLSQAAQLNHFQFVGDYDCFSTETFTAAYAQRLRAQADARDPTEPDPIQPERRNYLISLIKDKTDDQLSQMQIDLIRRSIAAGKRVFLIARRDQSRPFTSRYEKKETGLTWAVRAQWFDMKKLKAEDASPAEARQARPGNGPGNRNAFRPGRGGRVGPVRQPFNEPIAQWQVIEVTRKPEKPTTRPK